MMNSEAGIMEESRSDTVSLYLELRGTNPPSVSPVKSSPTSRGGQIRITHGDQPSWVIHAAKNTL